MARAHRVLIPLLLVPLAAGPIAAPALARPAPYGTPYATPHRTPYRTPHRSPYNPYRGGRYPDYWRRDANRWRYNDWNRRPYYNHWGRPCAGAGCYPYNWRPNWVRPGWNRYRPWNYGWYGPRWYSNSWNWWGPQSLVWGITALATAAIINNAMNNAIRSNQPTIVVPNTPYQLDYRTVEAGTDNGISFVVRRDGRSYQMDADCRDGELNGHLPNTTAEAELLNAACQVAFGT
jgi:hypothetical protein